MKITRSDSERIVIVDFPFFLSAIATVIAVIIGSEFVNALIHHHKLTWQDKVYGGLIFVAFFWGSVSSMKRVVFDFDLVRRQLTWKQIGLLGVKGGTVPFSQIKSASVETQADRSTLMYRVKLTTTEKDIPLAVGYYGGPETKYLALRDTINRALGVEVPAGPVDQDADLRAMVKSGLVIGAISLVRSRRGCSLREAKDIVDAMKNEPGKS